MESNEASWAAGLLSALGSIAVCKVIRKQKYGQTLYIRLTVRSRTHTQAVQRFGEIVGVPAKEIVTGNHAAWSVVISGDKLHDAMVQFWPELTKERKQEYKKARIVTQASKIEETEEQATLRLEKEARREAKAVADDLALEEKFKVWRDGLGEKATGD